jgi:hypothetical protein
MVPGTAIIINLLGKNLARPNTNTIHFYANSTEYLLRSAYSPTYLPYICTKKNLGLTFLEAFNVDIATIEFQVTDSLDFRSFTINFALLP